MYVAKLILVVVLTAVLLAFVLAPVVDGLAELRIPKQLGSLLAVAFLVVGIAVVSYLSYARAVEFISQVPEYRTRLQNVVNEVRARAEQFEKTTENVLPSEPEEKNTVTVREHGGLRSFIGQNASSFTEALLAISFVPFLTYFMLSWQDHVRASSVMLFQMKNRNTAYVALGQIAAMIRSFIVGNFMIGLFLSAASMAAFGLMGLPYFYFVGVISGFLSLIPYLGVVLAIVPPVDRRAGLSDDGDLRPELRHRRRPALVRHERAVSHGAGQALAAQPAGPDPVAAVLGMALGRHGIDPGSAAHRRTENYLRQHRAPETVRRLDGRIRASVASAIAV